MENVSNQLGKRIRQYRTQKGLTQETLALSSGITVSFLGDVERGLKKPSIESLEKLLSVLGVTFPEFFDFDAAVKPFVDCTALERLNVELRGRSDIEVDMIYNVVKQILTFNDKDRS